MARLAIFLVARVCEPIEDVCLLQMSGGICEQSERDVESHFPV